MFIFFPPFFYSFPDTVLARPTTQFWDLVKWCWGWTWAFRTCVLGNDEQLLFHLTLVMGKMELVSTHPLSISRMTETQACMFYLLLECDFFRGFLYHYFRHSPSSQFPSQINMPSVFHFKSCCCCGKQKDYHSTKGNMCPK